MVGESNSASISQLIRRTDHAVGDFGVYVHIPFCSKRCDYCAFATWTDKDALFGDYVETVIVEIAAARNDLPRATSIFFGGGTPSLLPGPSLMRILDEIPRQDDCEITVECNPDTASESLFETYRAHGVNRISFGVQSMVPHVLSALGRTHHPENVIVAVEQARRCGMLFNLDLIYGASGESFADWNTTVDSVLALEAGHFSAYALTVEANTPLAADPGRHPDDDDEAEKYERLCETLERAGYENYEISNWARPGQESRHNLLYWAQGDYRGFGCAAHSHLSGRRFWNVRTPERFIELIQSTGSAKSASEELSPESRTLEGLQLALRTRHGVPVGSFSNADLELFYEARWIKDKGPNVVLTTTGRMMANAVAVRLRSEVAR